MVASKIAHAANLTPAIGTMAELGTLCDGARKYPSVTSRAFELADRFAHPPAAGILDRLGEGARAGSGCSDHDGDADDVRPRKSASKGVGGRSKRTGAEEAERQVDDGYAQLVASVERDSRQFRQDVVEQEARSFAAALQRKRKAYEKSLTKVLEATSECAQASQSLEELLEAFPKRLGEQARKSQSGLLKHEAAYAKVIELQKSAFKKDGAHKNASKEKKRKMLEAMLSSMHAGGSDSDSD